jgi:bifunctional non-homologous end joining protein LigD
VQFGPGHDDGRLTREACPRALRPSRLALKWDGFRAVAETESRGSLRLYSRLHNDFTKRFPPIAHALAELKTKAILDGEICALDETGFPRFEGLVNRGRQQGTLVSYIFDLLEIGGQDLRGEPLLKSKKLLAKLLKNRNPPLICVDHLEREGLAMFAGALALGLEGIVAKDSRSLYVEGPAVTWHWQKIKNKDFKRACKFRQNKRR